MFEKTKQIVLHSKLQFIQSQLAQIQLRKEKLRSENQALKSTIRQAKTQQTFKSNRKNSLLNTSLNTSMNTSMSSTKKFPFFSNNQSLHCQMALFTTKQHNNNEDSKNKENVNKNVGVSSFEDKQIKPFQSKLCGQYRDQQQKLRKLQQRLQQLQLICRSKTIDMHLEPYQYQGNNKQLIYFNELKQKQQYPEHQNNQQLKKRKKTKSVNIDNVPIHRQFNLIRMQQKNDKHKQLPNQQVNTNSFKVNKNRNRDTCRDRDSHGAHYSIKLCAQTNNSKKSQELHRIKDNQTNRMFNNSLMLNGCEELALSQTTSSTGLAPTYKRLNSNISLINGCSQNGLNTSKMSNRSSNTILNQKSYAKVITSLQCQGCSSSYKPNQYYRHIEECRQYLLMQLERQKDQIDEKINETLNLSVSYF